MMVSKIAREYYKNKDMGKGLLNQAHALETPEFSPKVEKDGTIITKMARAGAQLGGFHGLDGGDLLRNLKSGSFLPDDVYGWSTKTVLLATVVALLLRKRLSK
jgi:hypothetical protein